MATDPRLTAVNNMTPNVGTSIAQSQQQGGSDFVSNTITPSQLKPASPINLTNTIVTPTDNGSSLVGGASSSATQFQTDYQRYLDAANQDKSSTSLLDTFTSLGLGTNPKEGMGQAQLDANKSSGYDQYNKDLVDVNAQILSKTAEYDKLVKDLEVGTRGSGNADIRASMLYGQQGAVNRQAASEIGLLQAKALGLQGKVTEAQTAANRAVDLMFQDKEAEYQSKLNQYNAIKDSLTGEEAKRGKALEYALNKEQKALEEEKANKKAITEMTLTALSAGAPQSAIDAASKATDTLTAAKILGKYSPETLKYELLKEQIKTEKAQQSNIYSTIKARNAESSGSGGGKPPTEGQVASAGYADRIQQANTIIDEKTSTFAKLNYAQFKLLESKSQLANKLLSADQRQAAQAMRNFITAKLRKESGAAISPTEFDDARLQYFPSLGDDPQTLANKKALRDSVLNNLIVGSGNAYTPTVAPTAPNKFQQATGNVNQVIPGTGSVSGFNKDGTINFKLQ